MLYELLDELTDRIRAVDRQRDGAAFAEEMLRRDATALSKIKAGMKGKPTPAHQAVLRGVGAFAIQRLIEPLPGILDELTRVAKSRRASPAIRCAVVGALAYAVKHDDLIPDDAPGGYGLVDDAVILHAAQAAYLQTIGGGSEAVRNQEGLASLAASVCPPEIVPLLDQGVTGTVAAFQFFAQVPAAVLEGAIEKLVQNPELAQVPGTMPAAGREQSQRGRTPRYPPLDSPTLVSDGDTIVVTLPGGEVLMS